MTRTLLIACVAAQLSALPGFARVQSKSAQQNQQQNQGKIAQQPSAPQPSDDEALPPEEDESAAPKVYPLDPLESDRNIKVGDFYMHQGKPAGYRAAVGRYEDAAKYNPNSAEAFFKLGEAEEKLKNKDAARTAFQKVIQLAPDSKLGHEAKKKLGNRS